MPLFRKLIQSINGMLRIDVRDQPCTTYIHDVGQAIQTDVCVDLPVLSYETCHNNTCKHPTLYIIYQTVLARYNSCHYLFLFAW